MSILKKHRYSHKNSASLASLDSFQTVSQVFSKDKKEPSTSILPSLFTEVVVDSSNQRASFTTS